MIFWFTVTLSPWVPRTYYLIVSGSHGRVWHRAIEIMRVCRLRYAHLLIGSRRRSGTGQPHKFELSCVSNRDPERRTFVSDQRATIGVPAPLGQGGWRGSSHPSRRLETWWGRRRRREICGQRARGSVHQRKGPNKGIKACYYSRRLKSTLPSGVSKPLQLYWSEDPVKVYREFQGTPNEGQQESQDD